MTAPGQPEEDDPQIPPPGQPQSPQAVEIDEALEDAESSLIPVIAGLIIAEMAREGVTETVEDSAEGAYLTGRYVGAPLIRQILRSGDGLYRIIKGTIEALLLPLGLFSWEILTHHTEVQPSRSGVRELVERMIDETVERVSNSMQYVLDKPEWSERDVYDLFDAPESRFHPEWTGDDAAHADPRSTSQRAADNFSRQMSRWLTRETVFSLQENVAASMGFTHKRWITMHDHKVRDFHRPLHGRAVPLGQKFTTPVGQLRYPGDTSAPIGLWINCRCVIEWISR